MSEVSKCQNCGCLGAVGSFCENCGSRIAVAAAEPPRIPAAEPQPVSPMEFKPLAVKPKSSDFSSPMSLSCEMAKAFIVGRTQAFKFSLKAKGGTFADVKVSLCNDREVIASSSPPGGRVGTLTTFLFMNVTPPREGVIALNLVVECRKDRYSRQVEKYVTDPFDVTVYPDLTTRPIATHNISIGSIHTSVTGHASDAKASIDLASLNDADYATFRRDVLARTNEKEERHFELKPTKFPNRLTLVSPDGQKFVHVFSSEKVSFGRQLSTNDVTLHAFNDAGICDMEKTMRISRNHFHVVYNGMNCHLCDGGVPVGTAERRPSSGLQLNGNLIPPTTGCLLNAGVGHKIELVPGLENGGALDLDGSVLMPSTKMCGLCDRGCSSFGVCGLYLTRGDSVRESYLILWKCASLGGVFPGFENHFLVWEGDRFAVRTPDGTVETLREGSSIGIGNRVISVLPYNQININV